MFEEHFCHLRQEAELSQRDRVMLRVIEYLAKSLNIIQNSTILQLWYGFLFAFYQPYL